MFKKLVAIAMASTMTAAMAITTFAASGLNDQEQKIITALENAGVPSSQIERVKAEFIKEGVDITATEAESAIANIDEAKKIVEEAGITSIEELKANESVLKQVTAKVQSVATTVGYVGTINPDGTVTAPAGSSAGIVVKDNSTGNTNDGSLKTTGVDFSTTATVVAGLGLSVAGVAIASKKRVSANA
jgi:hypothetical protein